MYHTIDHLTRAASDFGAALIYDGTEAPAIDFGGYGVELVDPGADGTWGGARYYGPHAKMSDPDIMELFALLTEPVVTKEPLTIERAKELIGQRLSLSYCDVNRGEHTIIIDGMEEEDSRGMIGQKTCKRLRFREILEDGAEEPGTWIYEWQGVFRRGSGAERLFIAAIN